MSRVVKREYRSDLRTAQASETRRSIVSAAAELFVKNGYGATTIDAVADAAGVSRKTVFIAVGGKLALLKTALDWSVAGDDRPVPIADRPGLRELLDQADPVVLLTGWVQMQADIDARVAPLFQALEVAAGIDAEARALLEQSQRQRLDGARTIVKRLRALNVLAPGLAETEAVDLAWLAGDPALFDRLVRVRGWSTSRFAEWLVQTVVAQLIAP